MAQITPDSKIIGELAKKLCNLTIEVFRFGFGCVEPPLAKLGYTGAASP